MTHFGTSAKYIDAVGKAGLTPARSHDLAPLRAMMSTGSPLAPESFEFVYRAVKADICLSSISGGTDIVSCFVLGDPTAPVWRGEIQALGLGMDVAVFDDDGRPGGRAQGRAGLRLAVPGDAGRVLERRRGRPLPRGLFRALPRRVGATATMPSSPSAAAW